MVWKDNLKKKDIDVNEHEMPENLSPDEAERWTVLKRVSNQNRSGLSNFNNSLIDVMARNPGLYQEFLNTSRKMLKDSVAQHLSESPAALNMPTKQLKDIMEIPVNDLSGILGSIQQIKDSGISLTLEDLEETVKMASVIRVMEESNSSEEEQTMGMKAYPDDGLKYAEDSSCRPFRHSKR